MENQDILIAYSNYITEKNERPKSLASFSKLIDIEESELYKFYTNFDKIESEILGHFIDNAIDLTTQSVDPSAQGSSKHIVLTFFFTLTEVLKQNRSLILFIIPKHHVSISNLKALKVVRVKYLKFLSDLNIESAGLSFIPFGEAKEKVFETGAWVQFCSILLYWMKDESTDFEKTDIFVEKSLKLSFDLTESNVVKSMFDLGKFLIGKA
jgi:hypothetical protein